MAANNCLAPPPHICLPNCVFLLAFPPNDPESAETLQRCLESAPLHVLENRLNQNRHVHNGLEHVIRGTLNDNLAWDMYRFTGMTAIVQILLNRIHYLAHNEIREGPDDHNFHQFDPIHLHAQLDEFDLHVWEQDDSDGSDKSDVVEDDINPPPPNPLPVINPPPQNPLQIIPPQNPLPIIPPENPLPIIPPQNPLPIIPPAQNDVIIPPPDSVIGVKRSLYELLDDLEPVHNKKRRASF